LPAAEGAPVGLRIAELLVPLSLVTDLGMAASEVTSRQVV
jgi:hypothetical protein